MENPALSAFVAGIQSEFVFGQVLIQRRKGGFDLRHVDDRERDSAALRLLQVNKLRPLVQFTSNKLFRPLTSAPNLQRGWRLEGLDEEGLWWALHQFYPGAVPDWFAAQNPPPPVTSYREFTDRQTGMYRITATVDDATAGAVARACCHMDFCLKRRLWTAPGAPADEAATKSAIPCLAPCAILLEFARKMARLEQQEKKRPRQEPEEIVQHQAEASTALAAPPAEVAESDFDAPENPRRLRYVLEKDRTPA